MRSEQRSNAAAVKANFRSDLSEIIDTIEGSMLHKDKVNADAQMREAEILKKLNTETEGKKILIKQLQAKLEKKTKQEAQVIMAIRE